MEAVAISPWSSRVSCVRSAEGSIVTVLPARSWLFALAFAVVLVALPINVVYRLPFADTLGAFGLVLAMLNFTRTRRLQFQLASDRLSVRAVTEHSFGLGAVERFASCDAYLGGELQPCVGLETSAGLVVFPVQRLTADDVEAAVATLNLELARVRRAS